MIINSDCIDGMRMFPDNYFDSVVTDPPYELGFMGKKWDASGIAYNVTMWREALRVLKPGGHMLAFSGSRTYHRMVCAIEDAGFEVRDQIMWIYGSGFPKSLDVSKAIDKAAGAVREVIGDKMRPDGKTVLSARSTIDPSGPGWDRPWRHDPARTEAQGKVTAPATPAAQQWQGWGTALKPAHESICVARKPLAEGTVAANVLEWGTGAVNIDACRVATDETLTGSRNPSSNTGQIYGVDKGGTYTQNDSGRWPANLIHDGSEEVLAAFPGEEARFFYCAKASKSDRNEGLEAFTQGADSCDGALRDGGRESAPRANIHPTVKPTDLMRYLCRLITPPGGTVLDPFAGSGSTGKAAVLERFSFVGFELSAEYAAIAQARIDAVRARDAA